MNHSLIKHYSIKTKTYTYPLFITCKSKQTLMDVKVITIIAYEGRVWVGVGVGFG